MLSELTITTKRLSENTDGSAHCIRTNRKLIVLSSPCTNLIQWN